MGQYGVCAKCGADNKFSTAKNKVYCGNVCWKNEGVQQANQGERKFVQDMNSDIKQQAIEKRIEQKDSNILRSVALKAATDYYATTKTMGGVQDVIVTAESFLKWLQD